MKPTVQQQAIYDAVESGSEHLIVLAVAGAGKTSTAVGAAQRARGRVGFVAFNKHIADHLRMKLNGAASACTLHSLGLAAIKRAFPNAKVVEDKAKQLLKDLRPRWFFESKRGTKMGQEAQSCLQLARMCKLTLAQTFEEMEDLVNHHSIDVVNTDEVFAVTQDLLQASAANPEVVDFDDMVWLPVRLFLPFSGFDVLFVDEAQDLNRCQQTLALAASNGGRMVVIGDPRQSIMGFSGADTESFPRLEKHLRSMQRGVRSLPLTVTFRCPTSHAALAQKLVPHIEAAPAAKEGIVRTSNLDQAAKELRPDDLVICRKNGPCLSLAYRLITTGTPAIMRGRDVGRGLTELLDRLNPKDCRELLGLLADYRDRELERLERRDAPQSALDALTDRVTCLEMLASQCPSIAVLKRFITNLFTDESPEGKVILSSVHRAKGLEAERVFILEPECLPMVRMDSKPWEIEQEMNLLYVSVTRAKSELVFVGSRPSLFQ